MKTRSLSIAAIAAAVLGLAAVAPDAGAGHPAKTSISDRLHDKVRGGGSIAAVVAAERAESHSTIGLSVREAPPSRTPFSALGHGAPPFRNRR